MKRIRLSVILVTIVVIGMGIWGTSAFGASGKVNINTATVEELSTLSKIGPVIAARIVEYRESNGPFQTLEDLMKVKGIGTKVFELNKNKISVTVPASKKGKKEKTKKK